MATSRDIYVVRTVEEGELLASSGQRSRMPPHLLQHTGRPCGRRTQPRMPESQAERPFLEAARYWGVRCRMGFTSVKPKICDRRYSQHFK